MAATSTRATVVLSNTAHETSALTDSTAPMPCAKRFGGPGTSLGSTSRRGVMTFVTRRPSGLNRGPAASRATNPKASGTTTHCCPARIAIVIRTTPAATSRADTSFTGLGSAGVRARPRGRGYRRNPDLSTRDSWGGALLGCFVEEAVDVDDDPSDLARRDQPAVVGHGHREDQPAPLDLLERGLGLGLA